MFRIPSLRELSALFMTNKTVAHATAGIQKAVQRLEEVYEHHIHHATAKAIQAADLRMSASDLEGESDAHTAEASRALRVRDNLAHLIG